MRILAISSASGACQAALLAGGEILAARELPAGRGLASGIAPMLATLLAGQDPPASIAVVVGPGSFTGLRAGIAAAVGIGLGLAIPVVGVRVAEALAAMLPAPPHRAIWVALDSRRAHLFLDTGDGMRPCLPDALPRPPGPVAVAGDAAITVAAALAARGADVMLTDARAPSITAIAAVALRRLRGEIAALPPLPLYVDPPATT